MSIDRWQWLAVKYALVLELYSVVEHSRVVSNRGITDLGDAMIFMVRFQTRFLTRDQEKRLFLAGPVDVRIKYKIDYLERSPARGELASITSPDRPFHPNFTPSGTLCAWQQVPRPSLKSILVNMWDVVRADWCAINLEDRQVLNPAAAEFYARNRPFFPSDDRPLFEAYPPEGPRTIPLGEDHHNWILA